MKIEELIKRTLDKIKPFLAQDGGSVKFVKFDNGIVYIKMLGNCAHCDYKDNTINETIENLLLEEIDGIIGVREI